MLHVKALETIFRKNAHPPSLEALADKKVANKPDGMLKTGGLGPRIPQISMNLGTMRWQAGQKNIFFKLHLPSLTLIYLHWNGSGRAPRWSDFEP
jgi:hypothetical protein